MQKTESQVPIKWPYRLNRERPIALMEGYPKNAPEMAQRV
jgi:hypothetical protein